MAQMIKQRKVKVHKLKRRIMN